MALDSNILGMSVLIGVFALLMIIGLLGWKGKSILYFFKETFFAMPYATDESGAGKEVAVEARVKKWEIYLPEEDMEWADEFFYLQTEEGTKAVIEDLLTPYTPFSARLFKEYYSSVLTEGKIGEIELKFMNPVTGATCWRRKKTFPVKNEQGEIVGIKGFLRKFKSE